jgi:acyl-CoA thioester hydrolase
VRVAEHRDVVRPEWLDSNGHMNLAYYVVVFDRGTDAWLDMAGLGAPYRAEGGMVFAVESHTLYRRELRLGAAMLVRTWLVAADSKRVHLAHEMSSEGALSAMQEVLFVHVWIDSRRVVPFSAEVAGRVAALAGEPAPDWIGRRIGLPLPAA